MGHAHRQRAPRQQSAKAGRKNRARFGSKNAPGTLTEEFDDDIDKFHKGADKIPLDVNTDSDLLEDNMEEPVFDLQAESSSEEDNEEGSDEGDLDDEQLSGLVAKMAKQSKLLRQKTNLMEEEDEDEAEEDQEGRNEKKAAWGKRKKMYYDADNIDYELYSSDEEGPAEEEAEALRLQRLIAEKLRPEDFDLEDEEDEDDERSLDDKESTMEGAVKKLEAKTNEEAKKRGRIVVPVKDADVIVEEVEKDVSALSKEEQMNVIMSDAPELVGLLAELRERLDELHNKIEPLLLKVKGCNHANKRGLRYLEMKRMLLLCYSQSILFYLLMKAEGRSVCDHPVIARLVEIRTILQKVQPIEKNLQNQIDKLLISSVESLPASNVEAHGNSKPMLQLSVTSSRKEENLQAPDASLPERTELESTPAKISEEIQLFTEIHETDCHMLTKNSSQEKPGAIVQSDEDEAPLDTKALHRIISSKDQRKTPVISGDMDLPLKEGLGERRAKWEMQQVPRRLDRRDDLDEHDNFALDEDEFYQETKRLKLAKQATKQNNSKKIILQEPIAEVEVGKRHISYQMEKNKGLTPHRKKLTKNPRKKYKLKHEKAVIRRKGQVREIKQPNGLYGGEATGIRTTISRSVRFRS